MTETILQYLWPILLILLNLLWLTLVFFGMPGNWLMIASTIALDLWKSPTDYFSTPLLISIVVIAVLAELTELFAGVVGAKRAGGSSRGALGALIGGVIGAITGTVIIPVPLLGTLIGACLGAAAGAAFREKKSGRSHPEAIRSGVGAGLGYLTGTICKIAAALIIWLTIAIAAFYP